MGCGSSAGVVRNLDVLEDKKLSLSKNSNLNKETLEKKGDDTSKEFLPQPLAFEIPINDGEKSIIRKLPPMRLQRLEDQQQQQAHSEMTLKMLLKRQVEAEIRRKKILSLRVKSAQQFQRKF